MSCSAWKVSPVRIQKNTIQVIIVIRVIPSDNPFWHCLKDKDKDMQILDVPRDQNR